MIKLLLNRMLLISLLTFICIQRVFAGHCPEKENLERAIAVYQGDQNKPYTDTLNQSMNAQLADRYLCDGTPLKIIKLDRSIFSHEEYKRAIEGTGRLSSYDSDYDKNGPFGLYGVFRRGDWSFVGVQHFSAYEQSLNSKLFLSAECSTDIFDDFQGLGFGSHLRCMTAHLFSNKYLGKQVSVENYGERPIRTLPLAYIFSDNEWDEGKNFPSTFSALRAGFRVVSLGHTIKMVYGIDARTNEGTWSEDRVKKLKRISLFFANDGQNSEKEKILLEFSELLHDFDLSQATDLRSLRCILDQKLDNKSAFCRFFYPIIDEFEKSLSAEDQSRIRNFDPREFVYDTNQKFLYAPIVL